MLKKQPSAKMKCEFLEFPRFFAMLDSVRLGSDIALVKFLSAGPQPLALLDMQKIL